MLNTYQHLFPQMAFAVSVGMVSGHDAISVLMSTSNITISEAIPPSSS